MPVGFLATSLHFANDNGVLAAPGSLHWLAVLVENIGAVTIQDKRAFFRGHLLVWLIVLDRLRQIFPIDLVAFIDPDNVRCVVAKRFKQTIRNRPLRTNYDRKVCAFGFQSGAVDGVRHAKVTNLFRILIHNLGLAGQNHHFQTHALTLRGYHCEDNCFTSGYGRLHKERMLVILHAFCDLGVRDALIWVRHDIANRKA